MSEVRFYHLERQNLDQVLPLLLQKALQNGHRIIVKTPNDQEAERLNNHLWTYDPNSFIPHGTARDDNHTDQPVWITANDDNPANADVLILTHGVESENLKDFTLICDMIDGRNEQAVTNARTRWKTYKDAEHDVTYWQQTPQGGWDKKS